MMDYFSIVVAIIGTAGAFAVVKYQSSDNKTQLDKYKEDQGEVTKKLFEKIDKHGEDIVALKTKQEANITAKEVHEQYISRELFEMHKQHIDHRFDSLDNRFDKVDGFMGKIIDKLENMTKEK